MAVDANPSLYLTGGIIVLVLWRVYARLRRAFGRQRFVPLRSWLAVTVFPLALLSLALASLAHPASVAALGSGVAAGAALGVLGLRLTRFEHLSSGRYYTPNAWLGVGLALLFIGRLAYRFLQLRLPGASFAAPPADFARSPLTLAIFGVLAGYYVVYGAGLLRWSRQPGPTSAQGDAYGD